jgi:hypothetical protein
LDKEVSGLGVRRIREFNLSLVGKWCWSQGADRLGLWFRLLASRYSLVRGGCKLGSGGVSVVEGDS